MSAYLTRRSHLDHLTAILGCQFDSAGCCLTHQTRPLDPRRKGCPYRDSIERESAPKASRYVTSRAPHA